MLNVKAASNVQDDQEVSHPSRAAAMNRARATQVCVDAFVEPEFPDPIRFAHDTEPLLTSITLASHLHQLHHT
jgi:hypothetical protein